MEHLTAKMSCFVRAYHYQTNDDWIFRDDAAMQLLGAAEYAGLYGHAGGSIALHRGAAAGTIGFGAECFL